MKLRFFAVPALSPGDAEAELNRFLSSHRIVSVDRQMVTQGSEAYWALCVSFLDGEDSPVPVRRGKIDYKEVLSPEDFSQFARLRNLRKEISQREGVPPYALFTNEQLAALVTQQVRTKEQLEGIPGVGPARVKKYGAAFLDLLRDAEPTEASSE